MLNEKRNVALQAKVKFARHNTLPGMVRLVCQKAEFEKRCKP